MSNDFYLIINSTTTDGMYNRQSGNQKNDIKLEKKDFNNNVKVLLQSPEDFYVIGVGFVHIRNGFGHQSTSDLLINRYNIHIPVNRTSLGMECGVIFVPQYMGERLAEGATELPEGAKLTFKVNFVNCKMTPDKINFIPFSFANAYTGFFDVFEYVRYLEAEREFLYDNI